MHRTQIEKKKNNSKDFSVFFFLFLLFSQLDMWDETWVQSKQPEIIQQYQRMMADKLRQSAAFARSGQLRSDSRTSGGHPSSQNAINCTMMTRSTHSTISNVS
jgi:hypothetical protein